MALAAACMGVIGASVWSAGIRCGGASPPGEIGASPSLDTSPPMASAFTDVTLEAGIDFVHENGPRGEYLLSEIMGAGGAFLDYDGDGWLDLYLVQSGTFGIGEPGLTSRLYRNDGTGHFFDVTTESGAGVGGYGMGCTVADFNLDGHADLYITRYTALTPGSQVPCRSYLGELEYCDPSTTPQTSDRLYHNLGGGRFADVSDASGIALRTGYGPALAAGDFDQDGWVDVYVANDQSPAFLWQNKGDGTLEEVALQKGCAYNADGVAIAGMDIVAEDLDADGDVDLFVFRNDAQPQLLRNEQSGEGNWLMVLPLDTQGLSPVPHARVRVEVGDRVWTRECRPQESYLVSTDPRVHFGLGPASAVDRIGVHRPGGELEWFPAVVANRRLELRRGTGSPERP